MSRAVPKFTSFRPKVHKEAQPAAVEQPAGEKAGSRGHHASRHSDKTRSRRPHDSSDEHSHRRPRQHEVEVTNYEVEAPIPSLKSDDTFTFDRVGDLQNLRYGSLHKYDIPRYHRTGYGRVLGLSARLKIDRDSSSSSEVIIGADAHRETAHAERTLYARLHSAAGSKLRHVVVSQGHHGMLQADFLPLANPRKRKRSGEEAEGRLPDYRSSEPVDTTPLDSEDDDSDLASDVSDSEPDRATRVKIADLTRQVRADPEDLTSWRLLILIQAESVCPGVDEGRLSSSQRRTVAEMRLSIYDKAMGAVKAGARASLLHANLMEGRNVWNAKVQQEMWERALDSEDCPASLWITHLDMIQSNSDRGFDDVKDDLLRLANRIDRARARESLGISRSADLSRVHMHMMLRIIRFINDAGYTELGLAIWQALITLNVLGKYRGATFEQALASFETSWDAEDPRFGESPVLSALSRGMNNPTSVVEQAAAGDGQSDRLRHFARFAKSEIQASDSHPMGGRMSDPSSDAEDSDDAMHVIFFSDLSPVLSACSSGFSAHDLVDAFLGFFDLPSIPVSRSSGITPWRDDPWLVRAGLTTGPIQRFSQKPDRNLTMLSNVWTTFEGVKIQSSNLLEFIKHSLQQFADVLAEPHIEVYLLAFVAHFFPGQALKQAKSLLKIRPSDLHLYNGTAQIEIVLGREEKAEKIWSSAAAMPNSEDVQMKAQRALLIHDWTAHALSKRQPAVASRRLLSFSGSQERTRRLDDMPSSTESMSSSTRLSLERDFKAGFEAALYRGAVDAAITYACLAQLLLSLAGGGVTGLFASIAAQCSTTDGSSITRSRPDQASTIKQAINESAAALLASYLDQHKAYRLADFLSWLSEALTLYPSSVPLLRLWHRLNSSITALDDIVNGINRPWLRLDNETPLPNWLIAIDREISRCQDAEGATNNSVRSLFSRALLDELSSVRHSHQLWQQWLDFELSDAHKLSRASVGRSKAEQKQVRKQVDQLRLVFFQGIKALPCNKAWILRGLQAFDAEEEWGMEEHELRDVYNNLLLKGMRIRKELP